MKRINLWLILNKLFVNIWFIVYYRHFFRLIILLTPYIWFFTCTHLIFACTIVKNRQNLAEFYMENFTSPKIWHERVSFYNRNSKFYMKGVSEGMTTLAGPFDHETPLVRFGKAAVWLQYIKRSETMPKRL